MYGTMMVNDLGSYTECRKLEMADYAIITANISHVPLAIYFGACIPHECQQADLSAVGRSLSKLFNDIYVIFEPENTTDMQGVFHPWTKFEFTIRKTDELMENWRENTKYGFMFYVAIAVPLLILISLIPSIYHVCSRMRSNYKVT